MALIEKEKIIEPGRMLLIFFILVISVHYASGQCGVSILANSQSSDTVEICFGDYLNLEADGSCILMFDNFDTKYPGNGWSSFSSPLMFTNPCDTGINGSPYVWFGSSTPSPRTLVSHDFDLSSGGFITFDLKFGIQNMAMPCEGPDQMNEGVSLQYSVDGGNTWNDIIYFCPNGSLLPANPMVALPLTYAPTSFSYWDSYSFQIPQAAQTTHTRIRWIQPYCNYYSGHYDDNWGVDNVFISRSSSSTVTWSHGASGANPPPFQPLNDQTFIVYVLDYLNPLDTVASDTVFIKVLPSPQTQIIATTTEVCLYDDIHLEAAGNYDFSWNTGDTSASIISMVSDTTTYIVTAINSFGCTDTDSVTVNTKPLPYAVLHSDTICQGQTYSMKVYTDGIAYSWSTGGEDNYILVAPDYTTQYYVTVTNEYACSYSTSSIIFVKQSPPDILSDTILCPGESLTYTIPDDYMFIWGDGFHNRIRQISPVKDMYLSLELYSDNGCKRFDSAFIQVHRMDDFYITGSSDTVCRGDEVHLSVSGDATSYLWSTGEIAGQITVKPLIPSLYYVTVYDQIGGTECSKKMGKVVNVKDCNAVFIPNAFSPRGYNTEFKPVGEFFSVSDYQMTIYNKWGQLLFQTKNPGEGWNGFVNGEMADDGVYVYHIRFEKHLVDEVFEKTGTVTLIR